MFASLFLQSRYKQSETAPKYQFVWKNHFRADKPDKADDSEITQGHGTKFSFSLWPVMKKLKNTTQLAIFVCVITS